VFRNLVDRCARIVVVIANNGVIGGGESLADTAILEHLISPLYVVYLVLPSPLLLLNDLLRLLIKMIVVFIFMW
jgi:hypothetical protein